MPPKRPVDDLPIHSPQPYTHASSSQQPSSSQGYAHSQSQSSPVGRASKHPRTAAYNRPPLGASQENPVCIGDDDNGDDDDNNDHGNEEDASASQGMNEHESTWTLYGNLPHKIVGVRYYTGYATVGEMVVVKREPHNQYDSNAIQVLNVQGAQIGHLPRNIASKLAKYMDRRSLLVEAVITGEKGPFDCPLELRLYGTNEPVERENLLVQMRADKLPIKHAADRKRKEAAIARQAQKKGRAVVGAGADGQNYENGMAEFMAGSLQGSGLGPSLADIMDGSTRYAPRIEQMVEEFGVKEKDLESMPKANQPSVLQTELHPFQLQALQWMLDKESPQLPAQGSKDVVQLWQRHPRVQNAFTNLATNFSITNPELASGGILADDMGLGKTIETIALIMADRELGRKAPDACNATLILAPVSVMSNWSTQMKRHIKPEHALRVMFWHGTRKQPITPKQIENYDVVISTYDSVSVDWYSQKSTNVPRKSGIYSVKWRRVILDEGHSIRNPKAKRTIAVTNIVAQSRWALTGTPIINNLKDLYSLIRFLRLSGGLDSFEIFHGAIMRPVLLGDSQGNRALQMLMSGICLRRKKEMSFVNLRLPDLSEYVHKIKLHPHEQEKYDALEAQAKGTLDIYRKNIGGQKGADTYRHLLEVLLRMRQLCNHWQLVGEERLDAVMQQLEAEGIVDLTEENKVALQKMLQLLIDSHEDCPICLETLKDPVITKCAHSFCTACIERVIDVQKKCPMCRAELESLKSTTVKPAVETSVQTELTQDQLADAASLEKNTSSKVEALLDILRATAQDPTNKTIIFSQWTSFLDLLQPHLTAANLSFTRIDGSMTAPHRDTALETFDTDPSCTIMLASLAVCSVGLNLVAGNHVIMADSWWAPAIEDQAVDRVHRLGQKRETKVFRLVVEGSVEERVLGIQEEKRRLMGLAFAEKEGGKKKKAGGMSDLMRLLGQSTQASQPEREQNAENQTSAPAPARGRTRRTTKK